MKYIVIILMLVQASSSFAQVKIKRWATLGTNNVVMRTGNHQKGVETGVTTQPDETSILWNLEGATPIIAVKTHYVMPYSAGIKQPKFVSFYDPVSETFSTNRFEVQKTQDQIDLEIFYSNTVEAINNATGLNLPKRPVKGTSTDISKAKAKMKARGATTPALRRLQEDTEDAFEGLKILHGLSYKPERVYGEDGSGQKNPWGKQIK